MTDDLDDKLRALNITCERCGVIIGGRLASHALADCVRNLAADIENLRQSIAALAEAIPPCDD